MAFKQIGNSLLVVVACCSVLSTASPLSYLRDNDQNGFPCQNQGSFTYLRDNDQNQAIYPIQSGPVNVVNNLGLNSQVQTISSYPGTFGSVGFIGNNGFGSNFINNVNNVNGFNGLSTIQYPAIAQVPAVQPVAQYAVQQPAFVGGTVAYPNYQQLPSSNYNNNQISNNQVAPVEINFSNQQPSIYNSRYRC